MRRPLSRWTFCGTEPDGRTIAENAAHIEADHAPLRAAIVEAVRKYGQKVLICAEQRTELDLIRPYVCDRLPEDVRSARRLIRNGK